jgi:murein DD-endopeptidase MepM/ murein hydrolase activator NlpD
MNQQVKVILRRVQIFLTSALTNGSPEGSGLGIYLRLKLKRLDFKQVLGVNLAGLAFFAGIVIPQTQELMSSFEVSQETTKTIIIVEPSAGVFQWPLRRFGISQSFSLYHPGMDLTDPIGTPIYPVAEGIVMQTLYIPYGYGTHILIQHGNNMYSLYAHMSKILVREGQGVTKNTPLGYVGVTGKTTGSHLHFEIYEDGTPTNPIEILPEIK